VREARERGVLPAQDDVGELALEVDEVYRSLSDDLEGEGVIAVPCIARLRLSTPHGRPRPRERQARVNSVALDQFET
jgi:hypothetical protein